LINHQLMDAEFGIALMVLAAASMGVMVLAVAIGVGIIENVHRRKEKEQGK